MNRAMALLARYRIALALVLAACAAVAAVFAFARPTFDREQGSEMIDIAELQHYTLAEVKEAFANHGLPLRFDNAPSEPLLLSSQPLRGTSQSFDVYYVSRRSGRMSWGPPPEDGWQARVGNVLVEYGGEDEAFLARVKAAVDELR